MFDIFFGLMLILIVSNAAQKKVAKFDRLDICEIGPSKSINISYFILKPAGHGSVVDARYEFLRNIKELTSTIKITKCVQKELLDSCEYVTTINIKNTCGYLAQKNATSSPMVYNHQPPLICPLNKGTFVLTHGTFDPTLMNIFPLENNYWKMEMSMYEAGTNDYLYKMCIEGQVVVYRE